MNYLSIAVAVLMMMCLPAKAQLQIEPNEKTSELFQLATEFRADEGSLSRFYVIESSPERRDRFTTFYNDYLGKLNTINFNQLSQQGQVDYLMIKGYIKDRLSRLTTEKNEYSEMAEWLNYAAPIYELEKKRRRGKNLDGQETAQIFNAVKSDIQRKTEELKTSPKKYAREYTRRAESVIRGHKKAIESVYKFYNGYNPDFSWWMPEAYEELNKTLDTYASVFKSKVDSLTLPKDDGSGIIGNPIGRKELIRQLKNEMIPYTPEELIALAEKEFAWCDKELLKASQEMGFGNDWKKAQEKVKQAYVPAGEQPEEMLRLYDESIAFLKKYDLLTIPPLAEETWRMEMMSAERQLIAPFFLGGETLLISYPTNEMSQEAKLMSMRGNNPHFSRAVIHHELIAGHHLQGYMTDRHKDYRFYYTPFWGEGWAFYWEMLLWDMDFPQSPEDRIGMLFWRMHRCARIIFSLNYHLNNWTPQECIDYLVDRVGHERSTAEGEVRRSFTGGYGPLYQIAYMIGGLQFYDLHEELVGSGKMTNKEFHDTILKENSMPVEMVRALLIEQKLAEDFATKWRFYD